MTLRTVRESYKRHEKRRSGVRGELKRGLQAARYPLSLEGERGGPRKSGFSDSPIILIALDQRGEAGLGPINFG